MSRFHTLLSADPVATSRRLALATIAALAVVITPAALRPIVEARLTAGVATGWVALSTALLSLVVARHALAARGAKRARRRLMCWGALAGALNAACCLAGVTLLAGNARNAIVAFLLGGLFGGTIGMPYGALYGLVYSTVTSPALRARARPSHESADEVRLRAGLLLVCASPAGLAWPARTAGIAVAALAWLLGAAGIALALVHMRARRRLLQELARGEAAELRLAERTFGEEEGDLLPFIPTDGHATALIVARRERHPYRGDRPAGAVALAPLADAGRVAAPRDPLLGVRIACHALVVFVVFASLLASAALGLWRAGGGGMFD